LIKARGMLEAMATRPMEMPSDPATFVLKGATDIDSIVIAPGDHEVMVERMRLDVVTETTETVVTTTYATDEDEENDGEPQTVTRDTAALWRFESFVTSEEEIDWRVLTFMERAPGLTLP